MNRLVVIPASGLVPAELTSDLGDCLSALAPIGGRPSIDHVLSRVPKDACLVVTVAEEDDCVERVLSDWPGDVHTVNCTPVQTLSSVISDALEMVQEVAPHCSDVTIVLSDTVADLDMPVDSIGVSQVREPYRYTTALSTDEGLRFEPVNSVKSTDHACIGTFRISEPALFRTLLSGGFYEGLTDYSRTTPLSLHVVQEWHDLGHLPSYYRYRRRSYLSRHFNSLTLTDANTVVKKSADLQKIRAEVGWYQALPLRLTVHAPRLLGQNSDSESAQYEMEHVPLPTVGEQLVWGRMSPDYWDQFFGAIGRLLGRFWCSEHGTASSVVRAATRHIYVDKTRERVSAFLDSKNGSMYNSDFVMDGTKWGPLHDTVEDAIDLASERGLLDGKRWTTIHGDLFPGNLFFDRRADRVVAIDPRGSFGIVGVHGDPAYDLAKLAHSFLGRYDFVIANLYSVQIDRQRVDVDLPFPEHLRSVVRIFHHHLEEWVDQLGIDSSMIRLAEAILFMSALPLHDDDPNRQHALLSRGLNAFSAASL